MIPSMKISVLLLLVVVLAPVPVGAKGLTQSELEQLIRGNTAEGVNRWNKKMIWFFDLSGEVRKRDDRGNHGKAKWSVNPKGEFCYEDKHQRQAVCGPVIPRGDGRYDVDIPGAWKWNTLSPGNPYKL